MSKPIEKLREHFNGRPVPDGAKCLADEREKVNAMIDAVETENDKMKNLIEYLHRCFVRGHDWGPYCTGETEYVEEQMRELGIEVYG